MGQACTLRIVESNFGGQVVRIREVEDQIRMASILDCDYFLCSDTPNPEASSVQFIWIWRWVSRARFVLTCSRNPAPRKKTPPIGGVFRSSSRSPELRSEDQKLIFIPT